MKMLGLLMVVCGLLVGGCCACAKKGKGEGMGQTMTLHVLDAGTPDSAVTTPVVLVQVTIEGTPVFRLKGSDQTFALRPGPGYAINKDTTLRVESANPLDQTAVVEMRRVR